MNIFASLLLSFLDTQHTQTHTEIENDKNTKVLSSIKMLDFDIHANLVSPNTIDALVFNFDFGPLIYLANISRDPTATHHMNRHVLFNMSCTRIHVNP